MKKFIHQTILLLILTASTSAFHQLKFPETLDPAEFADQLEAVIVNAVAEGVPIRDPEHTGRDHFIKSDTRDWESTLAKIANNPEKYSIHTSRVALETAQFRKDTSKNPDFVKASITILHAEIEQAIRNLDEPDSSGDLHTKKAKLEAAGGLSNYIGTVLEFRSPQFLQEVLIYLNGPEETKIGLTERYAPQEIATAFRDYGDERNIAEAKKFLSKLREVGKADFADDIERSIKNIEKNAGMTTASNENGSAAKHPVSGESAKTFSGSFWLYLSITVVVLLGGFVLLKRKGVK